MSGPANTTLSDARSRWAASTLRAANDPRLPLSCRIVALRVLVPRAHARLTLPGLLVALSSHSDGPVHTPTSVEAAREVNAVLARTERLLRGRRLTSTTCLFRALIRYAVLSRAGVGELRFVMGVHGTAQDMLGHAWLEHNEHPIGETLSLPYVRTFCFPTEDKPNDRR